MSKENKKEKKIGSWLPWSLSIAAVIFFVVFFNLANEGSTNYKYFGEVGDVFAGISATLAFIWIAFGYYQTNKSIQMHQEEIEMMREDLKENREVLKAQDLNAKTTIYLEKYKIIEEGLEARILDQWWAEDCRSNYLGHSRYNGMSATKITHTPGHGSRALLFSEGYEKLHLSGPLTNLTSGSIDHLVDIVNFFIECGKLNISMFAEARELDKERPKAVCDEFIDVFQSSVFFFQNSIAGVFLKKVNENESIFIEGVSRILNNENFESEYRLRFEEPDYKLFTHDDIIQMTKKNK